MKYLAILLLALLVACSSSERPDSTLKIITDTGHGSGVSIGKGYILSAAHVVKDAKTITIKTKAGAVHPVKVLWVNEAKDIALLHTGAKLPSSPLSCREVKPGEHITASGNPVDMEFLDMQGFVAGGLRAIGPWEDAIPADLTLIGGMSGGPVFDDAGEVVGINVGHMSIGLGMFGRSWVRAAVIVPSSTVCRLMART